MNCEWVKNNAFLYAYDELPDDQRIEFEQHVNRCANCTEEVKALKGLREVMSAAPLLEPSASLLADSRMKLQEALEIAEQERGWKRWFFDPFAMLHSMKFSPALAAAILIVGFGVGALTTYRLVPRTTGGGTTAGNNPQTPINASIAGISEIKQDPNSNNVLIKYDTLQPQTAEGNLNDQRIQQLLLYAARNNVNTGVRLNSVSVMAKQPDDTKVREALEASLRYDNNPGVRSLALQTLQPVRADSAVRMELQYLAAKDKDQAIKRQSQAMLATLPEID